MSIPIKLTKSGAGIAAVQVNTSGLIVGLKGIAGVAALDAEVWVAPQKDATTAGQEIAHMKAPASGSDPYPIGLQGIPVSVGQFILANFVDADANHEVWVYFD